MIRDSFFRLYGKLQADRLLFIADHTESAFALGQLAQQVGSQGIKYRSIIGGEFVHLEVFLAKESSGEPSDSSAASVSQETER